MDIAGWNERYQSGARAAEDLLAPPTPLVIDTAKRIGVVGDALDLACGTGRNALWLAEQGWQVTAVDGAAAAIEILRARAEERELAINAVTADLEAGEYAIRPAAWDLILMAYYLQRDLFAAAKAGVRPGGVVLAIVHTTAEGEEPTAHRLRPGELRGYFPGWEILHDYEGRPRDEAHKHGVAEIVARKRGG